MKCSLSAQSIFTTKRRHSFVEHSNRLLEVRMFLFFPFFFPPREFSPICYLRDGTDGYNGYVRETKDVAKMEARVQLAAVS